MKRFLSVIMSLAVAVAGVSFMTGCTSRDEQLKLFSQGEYMDEALYEEFESWYKEETGETVKVVMDDFLSNEDMYTIVSMDKADYDLICPSDYMVEKMVAEGLAQKVDKEVLDISEDGLFRAEYIEATRVFDPTLEYSVPYMFGTFGILYNTEVYGEGTVHSWADLFEDTTHRVSLKKSLRDTYHAASLYAARDTLTGLTGAAQKQAVQAVFDNVSDANISAATDAVKKWKVNAKTASWDDENGKFDMAQNIQDMGLFWSCDAGYVMSNYVDDSGTEADGNRNLWFTIPEEGGNVYLDSFIISKYAKNTKAANYFLKFLCTKAAAVANSLYCGAISPVAAAYDELKAEYEEMDFTSADSMFKDKSEEWKQMYIDMLFPPAEVLNRCGQMRNYPTADEGKVLRAMANLM